MKLFLHYLTIALFLSVACFCFWIEYTFRYSGGMAFVGVLFGIAAIIIKLEEKE